MTTCAFTFVCVRLTFDDKMLFDFEAIEFLQVTDCDNLSKIFFVTHAIYFDKLIFIKIKLKREKGKKIKQTREKKA